MRHSALTRRASFCAIEMTCCKAAAACSTSERRSEVLPLGVTGFGDAGGCEVGFGSTGGGEAVLNEAGRPGRASCQFGESERLRVGRGACR